MRATMTWFCLQNELHLSRIYHDWQVEPDRLKYPGLLHALDRADQPGTHSLFLADLDFIREPSGILGVLAEVIVKSMPHLQVRCFVDERAFNWESFHE